jgi:hypothetical protein
MIERFSMDDSVIPVVSAGYGPQQRRDLVRGCLTICSRMDDEPGTLPATFGRCVNREMEKIVFAVVVGALG